MIITNCDTNNDYPTEMGSRWMLIIWMIFCLSLLQSRGKSWKRKIFKEPITLLLNSLTTHQTTNIRYEPGFVRPIRAFD